jgi:hypothetical protein
MAERRLGKIQHIGRSGQRSLFFDFPDNGQMYAFQHDVLVFFIIY